MFSTLLLLRRNPYRLHFVICSRGRWRLCVVGSLQLFFVSLESYPTQASPSHFPVYVYYVIVVVCYVAFGRNPYKATSSFFVPVAFWCIDNGISVFNSMAARSYNMVVANESLLRCVRIKVLQNLWVSSWLCVTLIVFELTGSIQNTETMQPRNSMA